MPVRGPMDGAHRSAEGPIWERCVATHGGALGKRAPAANVKNILFRKRRARASAQTCIAPAGAEVLAVAVPSDVRSSRHKGQLRATCNQPPKQSVWKT